MTKEMRERIEKGIRENESLKEIAKAIDKDYTTLMSSLFMSKCSNHIHRWDSYIHVISDKMLKILDTKEITYDMITKEMLDVFMYRMIVVDRTHFVVVIDGTNTVELEELREHRKEIAALESIYSNTIATKNPTSEPLLVIKLSLFNEKVHKSNVFCRKCGFYCAKNSHHTLGE